MRNLFGLKYFSDSPYLTVRDYFWVAFYDYFRKIKILFHKKFNRYCKLIKANIFYLILFRKIVFISKPPIYVKRNEKGRLDCIDNYAIEFGDGYGLYYINGRHFSEEEFNHFFLQESSAKEILEIKNQEKRAEIIKHYGYEKIFESLRMKCISRHNENGDIHYLYTCEDLPINLLRLIDTSTKKPYLLGVPRDQEDCLEAIAWTFNITKEEYKERLES